MPEVDRGYLEDRASLLGGAGTGVSGEPLTMHRRGHWFETSIAHHSISSIISES